MDLRSLTYVVDISFGFLNVCCCTKNVVGRSSFLYVISVERSKSLLKPI